MAGSRAMRPHEPCQDRKVAALSGFSHVPEDSLAGVGARRLAGFGSVDGGVRGIYSERGLTLGQLAAFGVEGDRPARFPA